MSAAFLRCPVHSGAYLLTLFFLRMGARSLLRCRGPGRSGGRTQGVLQENLAGHGDPRPSRRTGRLMTLTFLTRLSVDGCVARLAAAGIGEADPSEPQPRITLRGLVGSQDLGVTRLEGNEFRLEFRGGIPRFTRMRPRLAFSLLPYILEGRFLPDGGGMRIQIGSRPDVGVAALGVGALALEGWAGCIRCL